MIPLRSESHRLLKAYVAIFAALGAQPRFGSCSEPAPAGVGTGIPLTRAAHGGPLNALTRIQDVAQHVQELQQQPSGLPWGDGGESGGQPVNFLHNDADVAPANSAAAGAAPESSTPPASTAAAPVSSAAPAVQQTTVTPTPPIQAPAPTLANANAASASNSLASPQTPQQAVVSATTQSPIGTPSQAAAAVPSVPATAPASASTPAVAAAANPGVALPGAAGAETPGQAIAAASTPQAQAQPLAQPLPAGTLPTTPPSPNVPLAANANAPLPMQDANANAATRAVSAEVPLSPSIVLPAGQATVAPVTPVAAAVSAEAPPDAKVAEATAEQSAQAEEAATEAAAAEAAATQEAAAEAAATQEAAAEAAAAQAAAAQAAAAQAAAVQAAAAQAAVAAQAQMLEPGATPASSTITIRRVGLHYGLVASNFYRGGGNWLLAAGGAGLVIGGLVGGLVPPTCWAGALYLGGALMSLLVATVLVGRRGAWLGALGGIGSGGVIGVFTYASLGVAGVVASTVVGLLLGIVLGFAPIFRGLKINERYICAGLRSRSSSSNTASEERTRSYEGSQSMAQSSIMSRRHRAAPKLSHGSQRYHTGAQPSDTEDGSHRKNTEDALHGPTP
ncbi:hypothetical protein Emed_003163 [Eimeria media]